VVVVVAGCRQATARAAPFNLFCFVPSHSSLRFVVFSVGRLDLFC
jgi:hypothetical protein